MFILTGCQKYTDIQMKTSSSNLTLKISNELDPTKEYIEGLSEILNIIDKETLDNFKKTKTVHISKMTNQDLNKLIKKINDFNLKNNYSSDLRYREISTINSWNGSKVDESFATELIVID